ncbi:MAG: Flp pilus assembly protein TadD [Rhodothermales bacterium]|jgi:Flp pilus assembly protein TadD
MHTRSLPLTELVTLVYLTALILTLTLVGCGPESEAVSEAARPAVVERTLPDANPTQSIDLVGMTLPQTPATPEPKRVVTYEDAEAAYREGDYEQARELFTSYTDARPDNPWGHYMLGLSAHKSGQAETAEIAFREALHLDPNHLKSWQNLTRVLLDSGRTEDAEEAMVEAQVVSSDDPVTFRLLGRAFHQKGDLTGSADAYRDAIILDEGDAWAMNNLALVLMEERRFEQALPTLAQAVTLRPDVAIFQNNLGMALEHRSFARAAEKAYQQAVVLNPGYEKAEANLARILLVDESTEVTVDLQELAAIFAAEIQSWKDEYVARELGELEPEAITTQGDQVQEAITPEVSSDAAADISNSARATIIAVADSTILNL